MKKESLVRFGMVSAALGLTLAVSGAFAVTPRKSDPQQDVPKSALPKNAADAARAANSKGNGVDPSKTNAAVSNPAVDPTTYRIGVEDELTISVWHEPELSSQVVVRPDGRITLPLVNDVQVVGLRTDELQNLLTEKLKPFVNTPQVTIIIRGIHSRKVNLIGQVGHQGSFDLNDNKTMLDLIAQAGGLGPFAKTGSIYILRQFGSKQVRIGFNYKKAISGKGPNPVLEPGDLVVVP